MEAAIAAAMQPGAQSVDDAVAQATAKKVAQSQQAARDKAQQVTCRCSCWPVQSRSHTLSAVEDNAHSQCLCNMAVLIWLRAPPASVLSPRQSSSVLTSAQHRLWKKWMADVE